MSEDYRAMGWRRAPSEYDLEYGTCLHNPIWFILAWVGMTLWVIISSPYQAYVKLLDYIDEDIESNK